eukprot:SAG22_NODE_1356_length_4631_cov_2.105693_8_plen_131_part_00
MQDSLQDVSIRGCSFSGNLGGGIMLGLHKLSEFGVPPQHNTSIEIDGCVVDGTGTVTLKHGHHVSRGPGPVSTLGILIAGGAYTPNAVRTEALPLPCVSTVFLSKTVPFRAVLLDRPGSTGRARRARSRS